MSDNGLRAAKEKMEAAGAPAEAVLAFENAYRRLVAGHEAMLPSAERSAGGRVRRSTSRACAM